MNHDITRLLHRTVILVRILPVKYCRYVTEVVVLLLLLLWLWLFVVDDGKLE